jgi:pimeloyl-ACP methyl ester carboxylesterase
LEKDINIDGQILHYDVIGEGKPLILMHGWGCNLTTVRSIAATASLTHKVYSLDMPGFGQSPEPPAVWGVDDYTRLVERFIQLEQIVNPVLAGHSFGGRIAILLASRSKNVDSLVLIDAAGIKPHRSLSYYVKVYTFKMGKLWIKLIYSKEKAAQRLDALRAKRGSSDYSQSTPKMRAILSRVVNEDLTDCLPLIKVPALLIWGENDKATPLADAKKMETLIPDAGLVSFAGCGHYSFLDNPIQFRAVLSSFLTSRQSTSNAN